MVYMMKKIASSDYSSLTAYFFDYCKNLPTFATLKVIVPLVTKKRFR